MKNLLLHLLGKSSDKTTNVLLAWPEDLIEMDDLDALRFSTQKLIKSIEAEDLNAQEKFNLMIEVETLNQPRLEKLSAQFSSISNIKPELENNISDACYSYCRMAYICHLKVIELVINPGKFQFENNLKVMIFARTINAALNMNKWRMFVQQNPPTNVWLQIYILYKVAAKHQLLSIPTELFYLSPPTTLSAFIVQICMFGQLLQANLQKQHIEITTKILNAWLTRAHISSHYTPENYLFYIDLERDLAAKRIRKAEPEANCRYWEIDDFEKQLIVSINVTDRGEMPASLVFSKIDNIKKLNETLCILHAEWRKQNYIRQRRREVREATSKSAKVNAGITEICNQVLHANQVQSGLRLSRDGKTHDELLQGYSALKQSSTITINSGSLDTWIITDRSKNGLGARVNKYANILARPNKLIGLVMDDDPSKLVLGVIRGVKPTQGNQLKVGIEIVSQQPVWIQLKAVQESTKFAKTLPGVTNEAPSLSVNSNLFSGLFLPQEAGISEHATLILPKFEFHSNQTYTIYKQGKTKRIELAAPIESQDDWVKLQIPAS